MSVFPSQAGRLLVVHAHPDDETLCTGILLADAVARGLRPTVLTCTLGEEGEVIPPELSHLEQGEGDPLGGHRRGELAAAMAALGVDHEVLGDHTAYGPWRDSGMAGSAAAGHPRALAAAPLDEVAAAITQVIERVRPDVIVTYDAGGGYGHPDHVRVHEATCRAVAHLADPPDLYAVVVPSSWAVEDREWLTGPNPLPGSWARPAVDDPYPSAVVPDRLVADIVVAPALIEHQAAALRAHLTQVIVGDGGYALSNLVAARLAGREAFARLDPATGAFVEDGPGTQGLRLAMRRWATGVAVVTLVGAADDPVRDHAMTVSSLTSVALDPPLVLFCVGNQTRFRQGLALGAAVGISALAADQQAQAQWFATSGRDLATQFQGVAHARGPRTGAVLLEGAAAVLEGRIEAMHPAGDHAIVVVRVLSVGPVDAQTPVLCHVGGNFARLP